METLSATLIIIQILLFIIHLAIVVFCSLINYRPINARQLHLQYWQLVATVPTQIGAMLIYGIFDLPPSFDWYILTYGLFFGVGVFSSLAIMIYRLQRIFFIVILRKPPWGRLFWIIILTPALFNVLCLLLPMYAKEITMPAAQIQFDLIRKGEAIFYHIFLLPVFFQIGVLVFYTIGLQKLKHAFNDFQDMKKTCAIAGILAILNAVAAFNPFYLDKRNNAFILVLTVLMGGSCLVVIILITPLHSFFIDRTGYEKKFEYSLKYERILLNMP
jgi:hypothetical protein